MKRKRWSTEKNRGIAAKSCSYLTRNCRTCSVQLTGRTSGNKKEAWLTTSTLQKKEKKRLRSRRQKMEKWGKVKLSNKYVWKAEVNERQLKQEHYHKLKDLSQYLREAVGINYQSMMRERDHHLLPKALYMNELCYYFPLSLPHCVCSEHTQHSPPLLFPFFSFPSIFPFSFPFS